MENSWTSTHHWAGTLELLIRSAMVVDGCDDVGRRRYRNRLNVEPSSTVAVVVVVIIGSAVLLLGRLAALLMIGVGVGPRAGGRGCTDANGQHDTGERKPEA